MIKKNNIIPVALSSKIKIKSNRFISDQNQNIIDDLLKNYNQTIYDLSPKKLTYEYLDRLSKEGFFSSSSKFDLSKKRILVIAIGKCANMMTDGLIEFVGKDLNIKILIASQNAESFFQKYDYKYYCFNTSHPISGTNSFLAGDKAIELVNDLGKDDIVICLISGGGSAMFDSLRGEISFKDSEKLNSVLIKSGIEGKDINIFRKLLSRVKGGKLAQKIYPASILNIIISDDTENIIDAIASGPTVIDNINISKIKNLVDTLRLRNHIPRSLFNKIEEEIELSTDVKKSTKYPYIKTEIILDNAKFISKLNDIIRNSGDNIQTFIYPKILKKSLSTSLSNLSKFIFEKISLIENGLVFIFAGGEVPVKVVDNNKGGRNQHFPLEMLNYLDSIDDNWLFFSIATDGYDYIKGIAGSYVSSELNRFLKKNNVKIESFSKNTNSYEFHSKYQTHLICDNGTGMNVADTHIFILFK